jgi:hypothetical protein
MKMGIETYKSTINAQHSKEQPIVQLDLHGMFSIWKVYKMHIWLN